MGGLVWLASYPKSGNTWMRIFLANLIVDGPEPVKLNDIHKYCVSEAGRSLYEGILPKPLDEVDPAEIAKLRPPVHESITHFSKAPVFVKTHNYLGTWFDVPLQNFKVTAAAIYMVRNPLDVVISCSHHYGETIDESIERMARVGQGTPLTDGQIPEIQNSWSIHVDSWTRHPNPALLLLRYEDMTHEPLKSFSRAAKFLKINASQGKIERAIERSSFKNLRSEESQAGFRERPRETQNFFREGRVEQWRERLSETQIRRIISDHRPVMERFGYVPEDYA